MATLRAPLLRLPALRSGVLRSFHRPNSSTSTTPRPPPPPNPTTNPAPRLLSNFLRLDSTILSRSTRIQRADPPTGEMPEFPTFTSASVGSEENMHHLNVYATKHNTHITLTKPNKDVILTLSCGNVGFKKSNRGTFEAAYQLASVMFARMEERGIRPKSIEIIYRDFGPGRDAFTKVLLGKEGKNIRESVVSVQDSSKLKFGGTRSRARRRL